MPRSFGIPQSGGQGSGFIRESYQHIVYALLIAFFKQKQNAPSLLNLSRNFGQRQRMCSRMPKQCQTNQCPKRRVSLGQTPTALFEPRNKHMHVMIYRTFVRPQSDTKGAGFKDDTPANGANNGARCPRHSHARYKKNGMPGADVSGLVSSTCGGIAYTQ